MSLPIDTLKSTIKSGLARSNQYRVFFHTRMGEMMILCDSVTWPGRQIFTNERYVDMKAQKIAYAFGSEDVSMSFLLTNDWSAWDFIYNWNQRTVSGIGDTKDFFVNFKNTYTEDVEIEHLDNAGEIKKKIKLKNAFPTTLSSIELGNGNENEVIRVSAEFSYDNWEIIS